MKLTMNDKPDMEALRQAHRGAMNGGIAGAVVGLLLYGLTQP